MHRFQKISNSKLNLLIEDLETKTIVFDFDETLAKVSFDKSLLPHYDEQVDILTRNKTMSVSYSCFKHVSDIHNLKTRLEAGAS